MFDRMDILSVIEPQLAQRYHESFKKNTVCYQRFLWIENQNKTENDSEILQQGENPQVEKLK